MKIIKLLAYIIPFLMCLIFMGCSREGIEETREGEDTLVNLEIDVALSDVPVRMRNSEPASNENEKMKTLRIVVVRPDNTVEANRLLELSSAVETYGNVLFKVVGKETKRIYLFVNEETMIPTKETGVFRKLLKEDLSAIYVGLPFPEDRLGGLTIQLDNNSEQILGPLPMSECHKVEVADSDAYCRLYVTRAAVKFSFRIINRTGSDRVFTGLSIDKMARREYYLPKDTKYNENKEIIEYAVPTIGSNEYYTFERKENIKLPVGQEITLDPIYLLEGKYTDPGGDPRNYRMSISLDKGAVLSDYFPDLLCLPRNTHVVVKIIINDNQVNWQVDLEPYGEVVLEPDFGL